MFALGPRSSPTRDYAMLFVMAAMALGILVFWGYLKARPRISRDELPVAEESEEPLSGDPSDPAWREVMRRRALHGAARGTGEPASATGPGTGPAATDPAPEAGTEPGATGQQASGGERKIDPWEPLTGDRDVTRDDARDLLVEPEQKAEAERAEFLPLLAEFQPLEPDAAQAYRIRITDRVAARERPKFTLPGEPEGPLTVVEAKSDALTAEGPGGNRRTVKWRELPPESMYELAKAVGDPDDRDASPKELVHLARLADLAGRGEEGKALRLRAARVHFRNALVERLPAGDKGAAAVRLDFSADGADYAAAEAGRAGLTARGADGKKRTFTWEKLPDEALYSLGTGLAAVAKGGGRARDSLHLSRLADALGLASEAAGHAETARRLEPLYADELAGRAQVSLNAAVLAEYSWPWDPAHLSGKDLSRKWKIAEAASTLKDDAPSLFHIFRYLRTFMREPDGEKRLDELARRFPPSTALVNYPAGNRGRVFKIRGGFIRRYKSIRFTSRPEHVEAGLRDLTFCFLSDTEVKAGVYIVSVPQDLRAFKSGDLVSVTGVYLRRWPYRRGADWRWVPWIVGMEIEKVDIRPARGWAAFIYTLMGLGFAAAAVLYFAARREWRDTTESRDRLHARRLAGRDRIRRKVAEAVKASAAASDGEKADEKAGGKPAPEGDAGSAQASEGGPAGDAGRDGEKED